MKSGDRFNTLFTVETRAGALSNVISEISDKSKRCELPSVVFTTSVRGAVELLCAIMPIRPNSIIVVKSILLIFLSVDEF